ncbi:MAG: hypothetical protein HC796_02725 [Synechococcaceae cyanobacterium RL_1_2]|nr:hypothetical protein [Synechococcaceae cyanobacterium RL_1_2]
MIDIVFPDRPDSNLKLWLILEELSQTKAKGFSQKDWEQAVNTYREEHKSRFSDRTAQKFFDEHILPNQQSNDYYQVDINLIQTKIQQLITPHLESLTRPIGKAEQGKRRSLLDTLEDIKSLAQENGLTPSQRMELIYQRFRTDLEDMRHPKKLRAIALMSLQYILPSSMGKQKSIK